MKRPNLFSLMGALPLAGLAYGAQLPSSPTAGDGSSPGPSSGAFYWADYDSDGHTDAYVVLPGGKARLLAGQGEGAFVDVTRESGLGEVSGVHQVAWADLDGDRRLDLFLASYTGESQVLLQREGSFARAADREGLWSQARPLNVSALDFDSDGRADLQLVTAAGDVLLRGTGDGSFERVELGFRTMSPLLQLEGLDLEAARTEAGLPPITPPDGDDSNLTAGAGGGVGVVPPPGPSAAGVFCPPSMEDMATGACIAASTVPTMGALYPLGNEFFIDSWTGFVGIGTTTPGVGLDVSGDIRSSSVIISTVTDAAPFAVSSDQLVGNLNADKLDGLDASAFSQLGNLIEEDELNSDSVTATKIADGAVVSSHIYPGAVDTPALKNGSVTAIKLGIGSVGSSAIADNQIRDVDISTAAQIHGSKIYPDFTNRIVYADGLQMSDLSDGKVDLGYGTPSEPSLLFEAAEGTGLASPLIRTISFLTDGVTRMLLNPEGHLIIPNNRLRVGVGSSDANFQVAVVEEDSSEGGYSTAVHAYNIAPEGLAYGVTGIAANDKGIGVVGWASSSSGNTLGMRGDASSPDGIGVVGRQLDNGASGQLGSPYGDGVVGMTPAVYAVAVKGTALPLAGSGYIDGVEGTSAGAGGYGVHGRNLLGGYGVFATGDLGASGTKAFVNPHPSDPRSEIRYVCLEGNEAGTYFRGTGQTENGLLVIDVPVDFRHVTDPEGLTVQVTASGPAMVWVESKGLEQIVVRSSADVELDYFVNGLRRGYQDIEIVAENRVYRPTEAGVPFGAHLPMEIRQMMVDNGTLNSDFTPNEETAAALGWTLRPKGTAAAEMARLKGEHEPLREGSSQENYDPADYRR